MLRELNSHKIKVGITGSVGWESEPVILKEWLPTETYGKARTRNKHAHGEIKMSTHTHTFHYDRTIMSTIKFGNAVNTKLMH